MYKLTVEIDRSGKIVTKKKEYLTVYNNQYGYTALEDVETGELEVLEPKCELGNLNNVADEICSYDWLSDSFLGITRFHVYSEKPEQIMLEELKEYIEKYFENDIRKLDYSKITLGADNGEHTAEA